ncbi:MAG: hypothetical protein ACRCTI_00455, partial [Beijerinckiaceae bacterium]
MKFAKTALIAAAFTFVASSAMAQMTGQYKVQGQNPDGSSYDGTARVEKTGDTWRVTWNVDGQRFTGTGIGDKDFIAIGYKSGPDTGVALLAKNGE